MAENMDFLGRAVAGHIAERLGIPIEFVDQVPWQERERLLDAGQIHAGWICGLPYVRKVDRSPPPIELLAAPVMAGSRYGGRPVYFSDLVVRRDSNFQTFADLRGASWAVNEPGSHSGYNVVRYHLARLGEVSGYFGNVIESGAHQTSLRMILEGRVDASAIDSTVLELELKRDPAITSQIRIIDTLGPSPIPPWVVLRSLSPELRQDLREVLLRMHLDPQGRAILAEAQMARFTAVQDSDYDAIRRMAHQAQDVAW
jgi:phosphonate transport system substrate-binding protein